MSEHELRRWIAAAVGTVLVGCGPGGDWPDETWDEATCTGTEWTPLAALEPAVATDFLRLSTVGVDSPPQVSDELGEVCSGATDRTACEGALEAVEAEATDAHLSSTSGDEARTWTGRGEVGELLGTIDDPDEALVLAWADGSFVTCHDRDQAAQRVSPDGGFDVVTTHYESICSPIKEVRTLWHVSEDGSVEVVAEDVWSRSMACIGRRPPGFSPSGPADGEGPGAWLARAAELEAASVPAFERLAVELEALGAPADLVADAGRFADDERRHTVEVGALAARFGGTPRSPTVVDGPPRDLRAMALDNAVEGCVREAWGALLGAWQAATATDPDVRRTLARVAADEAAHAALSLRIAAWVDGVADDALRAELGLAAAGARRELGEAMATPLPARVRRPLGLPDPAVAARLLAAFDRGPAVGAA